MDLFNKNGNTLTYIYRSLMEAKVNSEVLTMY